LIAGITLITGITLFCDPPAWCVDLVGRVLNSHGEPVSGVTLSVVNSAGVDSGNAVSDADGRYAISNLTPGTYTLSSTGQSVMSYIGEQGLTVNWGLAPHSPPVAVATQGTAADSSVTSEAPPKISNGQPKPEMRGSNDGTGDNN
jgi:hypothetical protein